MLKIINLKKNYGKFEAVKGINLRIKKGEIFGFLGPNGAGKTTTIKMITGLLLPTEGDVIVDKFSILEKPLEAKRIMGFIPDRPFIYEKLTGEEFLYFVSSLYGYSEKEVKTELDFFMELFELDQWRNQLIENYSHGMKQRLVMIGAFIHHPRIIIVDEPMVGLDPKGAKLVKKTFWKLAKERGITIFMSTHSLEVAEEMCERIAIIDHGEIITTGTMEELREKSGKPENSHLEDIFLKLTGEDKFLEEWEKKNYRL